MKFSSLAKVVSLSHTRSHEETKDPSTTDTDAEPVCKVTEPHKIETISSVKELEKVLDEHFHRRVVVFCMGSGYRDPDVDEQGWYHHYEKLHDVHFIRCDIDASPDLEAKLSPKAKPSWFTYHKGLKTGWSAGGIKRYMVMHNDRKPSA